MRLVYFVIYILQFMRDSRDIDYWEPVLFDTLVVNVLRVAVGLEWTLTLIDYEAQLGDTNVE